ncbi:hypothetical protein [Streptomyces tendae]|uniref:hypothetical protein n=1 Tax=Streptomyces tendae TaxID=1932 RepID=UPI003D705DC6
MTTTQNTSETNAPTTADYHWVMTVQYDNGRRAATYDGPVNLVPGVHTRMATYTHLRERMQKNIGTDQFVVLFFDLQPNRL